MSTTVVFATAFTPTIRSRRPQLWGKIRLLEDAGPWVPECVARISEFSRLPQDWDSYGSSPVAERAMKMAFRFLAEAPLSLIPEPSVSPVAGGGVGFHWRAENRDLELEFLPDGAVEFLKTNHAEPREVAEEGLVENFMDTKLWQWLRGDAG